MEKSEDRKNRQLCLEHFWEKGNINNGLPQKEILESFFEINESIKNTEIAFICD